MKSKAYIALAAAAALAAVSNLEAAAINSGEVLVYRVGNGTSNALANTGSPVFVDRYTPSGTLIGSIAFPTSGDNALVASGTATSEGMIAVSPNGQWITVTGYNATLSGPNLTGSNGNLANSASATVNRIVAVISTETGDITYTRLSDFASGNNPRSAVTDNGTNLWVAGGAGGVRYTTVGSTTSTQLTTLANNRVVGISGGNLFASNQSTSGGNSVALGQIGTGLPTTGPTVALTALPGLPGPGGSSSSFYQFAFVDQSATIAGADTLYIADNLAGAGIRKYSLVDGSWSLNGTFVGDASGYFGLSTAYDGTTVTLFATRGGGGSSAGGGQLVSFTDTTGWNAFPSASPVSTLLASAISSTTAGTFNTAFRGVAVVPEPAALGLLIPVAAALAGRRRR